MKKGKFECYPISGNIFCLKYFAELGVTPPPFNLIWPSLFWCTRDLNIFGLGGVRVPIIFRNYFWKLLVWMPRNLQKMFDFWNFYSSKGRLTRFVRVPPSEILVFPTNFIFSQGNEITLRCKKCTALFQAHNWEKSSFFNALVCVFAQIYAGEAQCRLCIK